MKNSRIVFYGLWPSLTSYVSEELKAYEPIFHTESISRAVLDPNTEVLVVFVDSIVTQEIIQQLPKLKYIATLSTGYDHIDMTEAAKRGITVCNVPSYGEHTVAEYTFALLLALTRKVCLAAKQLKERSYNASELCGVDLNGKTMGVVGTGRIGAQVISLAKAFGMRVVAFDAFPNRPLASDLGFEYLGFNELLACSDMLTFHAPLLAETHHMLNQENSIHLKPGCYVVNTARGALIEPQALLSALDSGQVSGAALDVLENEEVIFDVNKKAKVIARKEDEKIRALNLLLINHPRVIITPHNAFNSTEALRRIVDITVGNIIFFLQGKEEKLVGKIMEKAL